MKNKILAITIASVFTLGTHATFYGADHNWNNTTANTKDAASNVESAAPIKVASLRGTHALESLSIAPAKLKWIKKGVEFERSFDDQPPVVPHKTESMPVNLKQNKCLSCHSDANYKEEESPKMSSSHFFTREDKRLSEMSPRRYFCLQCHVPQADKESLIGSTFVNLDE